MCLFLTMSMSLGLNVLLYTRCSIVEDVGVQVSGPMIMAPFVVRVFVSGLSASRNGQPYGVTMSAMLQGMCLMWSAVMVPVRLAVCGWDCV